MSRRGRSRFSHSSCSRGWPGCSSPRRRVGCSTSLWSTTAWQSSRCSFSSRARCTARPRTGSAVRLSTWACAARGARGATCGPATSSPSPQRRSSSGSSSSGPCVSPSTGRISSAAGESDTGAGNVVFEAILGAIGLWAAGLLVYGISVVEHWSVVRSLVALALVVLSVLVITFPFLIPLASR